MAWRIGLSGLGLLWWLRLAARFALSAVAGLSLGRSGCLGMTIGMVGMWARSIFVVGWLSGTNGIGVGVGLARGCGDGRPGCLGAVAPLGGRSRLARMLYPRLGAGPYLPMPSVL